MLLSVALIPYAGIQDDEALFATPLYDYIGPELQLHVFHHDLSLMIMSYLGTLKTLIYWPLLLHFGAGLAVIRGPVALFGSITVFLVYYLARSTGSRFTAGLAALLLATDPTFLLTNTFDWGPVALEQMLFMGGCLLVTHFVTRPSRKWALAAGFFLFGLAVWNKAVFLWPLAGVTAATLVVFRRELKQCLSPHNIGLAATGLLLGSLPFVIYNLNSHNATVGENAHLDTTALSRKWSQIRNAANGNALFGFIAEEEWVGPAKPVTSRRGRLALWVRHRLGEHRRTGFYYAFGALALAVPLWWKSRPARFCLIFLAVTWPLMALTRDAGGATHHVVLLWPFPILFVALAVTALPWRSIAFVAGSLLVALNLLVVNQYVLQLERDGAAGNFTDALFSLSHVLAQSPDRPTFVIDWGIQYSMELAHQGRLRLYPATDPLMTETPNDAQRSSLRAMLSTPDAVFVGHVREREQFEGVGGRLEQFASTFGYHKQLIQTIFDSNGRPVFEIFRMRM